MISERNTFQKSLVYETVCALHHHPTAIEIYEELHKAHPTVSRATVYRILGTLSSLIATDNPNKNRIVVIDAATLTVKKDLTIATKTFAIAYDEAQNSYWLTCAGTYDFVRADTDLKQIGDVYAGYNTGYTKQAMDYDGEYLYFLQSGTNAVSIFRKDGVFIGVATFPALTYTLPNGATATASSVQSICHVGDTFYIGCYFADYGCVIYECEIDIKG